MRIGDICHLLYPGKVKDLFRLVKVVELHPGDDGLVRTVTVEYVSRKGQGVVKSENRKITREVAHVQRLIVLQNLETEQQTGENKS